MIVGMVGRGTPVSFFCYNAAMIEMIEIPANLVRFQLPDAVHARLQELLDRQDGGTELTAAERDEAEGLVELAEFLSLLQLRAHRKYPELS